jgi:hypothetical protein
MDGEEEIDWIEIARQCEKEEEEAAAEACCSGNGDDRCSGGQCGCGGVWTAQAGSRQSAPTGSFSPLYL